jgi:hypothetical protein
MVLPKGIARKVKEEEEEEEYAEHIAAHSKH